MKYFKFTDPYYAVIGARNKERAIEIYEEEVCDIDEGFECEETDKDQIIKAWERAGHELHELVDIIWDEGLYLVDSALL